jgi:GNAT superfamily N-acetyltransferase
MHHGKGVYVIIMLSKARRNSMTTVINTKIQGVTLRMATIEDTGLILDFIKQLAEYEHLLDEVIATEELLKKTIFEQKSAEVVFAELDGNPVGFALFFHNFSTFLGRPGLYLEDLFVKPEVRGRGIGKLLLSYLAKLAIDRGCGRFEWWCLDWNEPAIDFYKSIGAIAMDEWTVFRVCDNALTNLAAEF